MRCERSARQGVWRYLVVLYLSTAAGLNAQVPSIGNYAAVRATGVPYSSIFSNGVACTSWRNNTGFLEQDDNRSDFQDIGFDFWYNGTRYTQFSVSTNGFIDFSAANNIGTGTGAYGYVNTAFSAATNTTALAVAPYYDDLTTLGVTDPLGNSIRYQLSGSAPNRVLTVEWKDMSIYQHPTVALNFQAKIYETSGIIEYRYGNMTPSTAQTYYSYTCGINAADITLTPPLATEMKCQVSSNNASFDRFRHDTLRVPHAANSRITLTPPVPANPPGPLTFTAITQTSMTLNWADWASNEAGYVIYNSTDNVNYFFVTQTAANASSANITGLASGTAYYWKVFAVTEGCLSNALTATQATLSAGTYISAQTGNWATGSTWVGGVVPPTNADVIITSTHTVTINSNPVISNLTVGQGGAAMLRFGNNNTARTLTVNNTITVAANATLTVNPASNITHSLQITGNIVNNGTLNLQSDNNSICNTTFSKTSGNQVVSGSGGTTLFGGITVNIGNLQSNTVEIMTPSFSTFSPATAFLTLTNGTFKISSPCTVTAFSGNTTMGAFTQLWVNHSGANVSTAAGDLTLSGKITVSAGTLNIGTVADNSLLSLGGMLSITGGTLNVAGRYDRANTTATSRFSISGGTMNVPTVGSTNTSRAPFMVSVPGSTFLQSGGTIVIQREGGTGAQNLGFDCSGGNINIVTGGTLQIGNSSTPVGQTMLINTVSPVGALLVFNTNAPVASLSTNALTVINNVTIMGGTLLANNLNLTVGGNWSNTGGTYTPGTNTTTFNGTAAQLISKTTPPETFNHLAFSNGGTKSLGSNINCNNVTINAGATFDAGAGNYTVNMRGNWSNAGTYNGQASGLVNCNGTVAQTIGGTAVTNFRNLTIANAAGVSISSAQNLLGTLTLTSGVFTTTGQTFTLVSDASGTARIAAITGGNITGNISMQRYMGGNITNWRQLGSAVTGGTLASWSDDFVMSGFPGSQYPSFPFISMYTYSEPVAGVKENGYIAATNISNSIPARTGFFCYIGPTPITVDITGPPGKFAQNFTLSYTATSGGAANDGWNMVANPYPSTIDWDAAGWTKTNVANYVQVWNPTNQQYASYTTGVGGINGGSRYIPSSQAFWVHATGASPAMSIDETVKNATDQGFMRWTSQQLTGTLRLHIDGNNYSDETLIHFEPSASLGFDPYDAYKFFSPADSIVPSISSVMNNEDYGINSIPTLSANISIPIRALAARNHPGTYTISRDTSMYIPQSMCVVLEDTYNGTMTDLTGTLSYSFSLSDTTQAPRFLLHLGVPLSKSSLAVTCPGGSNGIAIAEGIGSGPWDYSWEDAAGNPLATHTAVNGPDSLVNVPAGVYRVTIAGNSGLCGLLSDTVQVNGPAAFLAAASVSGVSCPGAADGSINVSLVMGGTAPYSYEWSTTDNGMAVNNLTAGSYWLNITDSAGCNDTVFYTVPVNSALSAAFSMSDDTVYVGQNNTVIFSNYSSGGTGYSWDFGDGSPADVSSNPFHVYTGAGTFTVTLTATDSVCTDTAQAVLLVIDPSEVLNGALSNSISLLQENGAAYLSFAFDSPQDVLVELFDASGKLAAPAVSMQASRSKLRLPVEGKAEGIYLVKITTPDGIVVRRLKV